MTFDFFFLRNLPENEVTSFLARVTRVSVDRGTLITERGARPESLYLVYSGELTGFIASRHGREVVLDRLRPGDLFGELSVLDGGSRVRTVRSETACDLGKVSGRDFNLWLDDHPTAMREILAHFAGRGRDLADRLYEFSVFDVETRVRRFLVRQLIEAGDLSDGAVLDPAPTHGMIAGIVGANREAVSRSLSRMVSAGILETKRQRIVVNDVRRLESGR
ncbi:MAG: Crp/Fnr family transcriptional regulator [Rhodobacteraceae bacterium]|nr:Crp/Fnr family transcriptional regulator [Paracoccaceae bacterium]